MVLRLRQRVGDRELQAAREPAVDLRLQRVVLRPPGVLRHDDAGVARVGAHEVVGQRPSGRRVLVLRQEPGAPLDGVLVPELREVGGARPDVGDVEHRLPADLGLHAGRVAVQRRRPVIGHHAVHRAGRVDDAARAGQHALADRLPVVHRVVPDLRRRDERRVERLPPTERARLLRVVEHAEVRPQRRAAVAEQVVGEADPRLEQNCRQVLERGRDLRVVVTHHAVVAGRSGHQRADDHLGPDVARVVRIHRHPDTVDHGGHVELRRVRVVEARREERGGGIRLLEHRVLAEAHPDVQRQAVDRLPLVLHEDVADPLAGELAQPGGVLLVRAERSEQGVRVRVAGAERVRRIAVEVVVPGQRAGALALDVGQVLDVGADLEVVAPRGPRQPVVEVEQVVVAVVDEARIPARVGRVRDRRAERHRRNDAVQVVVRVPLRERVRHHALRVGSVSAVVAAVVAGEGGVGVGAPVAVDVEGAGPRVVLGRVPPAEVELVHHVVADDARVVGGDGEVVVGERPLQHLPAAPPRAGRLQPVREAGVDRVVRARADVDAGDVVDPGRALLALELVVVVRLPLDVRIGVPVQQRLPVPVDPVRRDDVARELHAGQRIDHRYQVPRLIEAPREVAHPLRQARHRELGQVLRRPHPPLLVAVEEEHLVLDDGAAGVGAEGPVAVLRLRDSRLLVEVVLAPELLAAAVGVGGAGEVVRPRLGDQVDLRAAVAPRVGGEVGELDVHLADRVRVHRVAGDLRQADVVAGDAVDGDGAPALAGAAHVRQPRADDDLPDGVRIGLVADARQDPQHRGDVAAADRDGVDRLLGDQRRAVRADRLDDALRGDLHGLLQGGDRELHRADVVLLVGRQLGARQLVGSEAWQLDADRVRPGLDRGEVEDADLVRDGVPQRAGLFLQQGDRRARQDQAAVVDDVAGKPSSGRLGVRVGRQTHGE